MKVIFMKGATAYELQIGRYWLAICHLKGEYWAWRPWRRISLYKEHS